MLELEKNAIEELKCAFINNPDDIAAIIIEPIQGEGGDNHFRPDFFKELRLLADDNDALLIFDEIQSGIGLTGTMWAYQQMGVTPDILVFGKKLQVCGIVVTERIDDQPDNVFHVSSRINSTWGGNLVDMVRATRYLEIIEEENLVENAARMGKVILNRIQRLAEEFAGSIYNIRGRGLMCAFDMQSHNIRNRFVEKCFERGLFILGCGDRSIRFRPPLNISESEIDEGFLVIMNCLELINQ